MRSLLAGIVFIILYPISVSALDIRSAFIFWQKFQESTRHPMYHTEQLRERTGLELDIGLPFQFGWWNRVYGGSSDLQFRTVGWHFRAYWRPARWIEGGWEHHSRHNLDQASPLFRFPVEDSAYIRFHLR